MDFKINEEQQSIANLADRLFANFCDDEQKAAFAASPEAYQRPLWEQMAETGLLGLTLPEAYGGVELGMFELALVLEQQGRYLAAVPLWRHQMAALTVSRFADTGLKTGLLPKAVTGELMLTLSLDDMDASTGLALQAEQQGDHWQLSGEVSLLAQAGEAQWAVLPAQTAEGIRLCLVALDSAGVDLIPGIATDGEPVAGLRIEGMKLPAAQVLPAEATDWLLQRATACVAALQLGVADEALKRTAAYITERIQFEQPIGTFQGVALRAADGYIDCEAMRSTMWQLAWRLDAGLPAAGAAGTAKYWACQGGHRVSHTAQHLHGGMGADITYPIHRYFLASRALELSLGGASVQLQRLGDWLADDSTAGFDV